MSIAVETNPLHPASACCLEALQWLYEQYEVANTLEIGCGNGILTLAAAGLWKTPVLAVDISPQAVTDTKEGSIAHGFDQFVTTLRSDGFSNPEIHKHAPYDLIIINLLAEPIVKMLPDVKLHLAEGGMCILSGIRVWETEAVESMYYPAGFENVHKVSRTPWHTFVMRRV